MITLFTIWGEVVKHPFDLGCVVLVLIISFLLSLQTKFKLFNYENRHINLKDKQPPCKDHN